MENALYAAGMITNIIYFAIYSVSSLLILWRYSKIMDLFTVSLLAVYIIALGCTDSLLMRYSEGYLLGHSFLARAGADRSSS